MVVGVLLLVTVSFFVLRAKKGALSFIGLGLMWLGGSYNLYQRVVYNCVSDSINFFHLFMFNPADLCVTAGMVIIILGLLKNGKKNTTN